MDEIWQRVHRNILLSNTSLQDHSDDKTRECVGECLSQTYDDVIARCRASRKKKRDAEIPLDLSDENLSRMASLTDHLPLDDYDMLLHLVPRLVNVVTLAEAIPAPGSGLKLPLDLHHIASHCSNAFYAPRRFAAVQLAFDCPRCRVLVFHTGRLVGTGV